MGRFSVIFLLAGRGMMRGKKHLGMVWLPQVILQQCRGPHPQYPTCVSYKSQMLRKSPPLSRRRTPAGLSLSPHKKRCTQHISKAVSRELTHKGVLFYVSTLTLCMLDASMAPSPPACQTLQGAHTNRKESRNPLPAQPHANTHTQPLEQESAAPSLRGPPAAAARKKLALAILPDHPTWPTACRWVQTRARRLCWRRRPT